jgi:predicted RNA binding protein YcfA (HicA-like mRNA interferase family)
VKPLTGPELCKVLERHGWVLARIRSSHHIYIRPGSPVNLSVPIHKKSAQLAEGTFKSLLRKAGLTEADL